MNRLLISLFVLLASGCAPTASSIVQTPGEKSSGFGYVPLDGLAVAQTLGDESCAKWRSLTGIEDKAKLLRSTPRDIPEKYAGQDPFVPLLKSLPDISVRYAIGTFDASAGLTFGPARATVKGENYRAILDYVNVDAIPVTFLLTAYKGSTIVNISGASRANVTPDRYVAMIIDTQGMALEALQPKEGSSLVTIPVYVGIGMRLSADITALEGTVPLTSLGIIGFEAQAKRLAGTLTVQTIGISGEAAATSLPLPSSLDQTSIENAILAIGTNRAVVYRSQQDDAGIVTTPRVVGLYSPVGSDPAIIHAIYSELSRERPKWERPCNPLPPPQP